MQPDHSSTNPNQTPHSLRERIGSFSDSPKKPNILVVQFQNIVAQSLARQTNSFRNERLENEILEDWQNSFSGNSPEAIDRAVDKLS